MVIRLIWMLILFTHLTSEPVDFTARPEGKPWLWALFLPIWDFENWNTSLQSKNGREKVSGNNNDVSSDGYDLYIHLKIELPTN